MDDLGAFDSLLAIDTVTQQGRVARLLLSYYEADPLMSAEVFSETETDPRGQVLALIALVAALAQQHGDLWLKTMDRGELVRLLRKSLADWAGMDGV